MTHASTALLIEQIDQCLPQTQCTLCSYPRCRQYAQAIAEGTAAINQCPPGGEVSIKALSELLGKPLLTLNEEYGTTAPKQLAAIDESRCIGCKLCIKACPVDCIVGAAKRMHTVIVEDCTGCKLCVPVCPTDCIDLIAATVPATSISVKGQSRSPWSDFTQEQITRARDNVERTIERQRQREQERIKRKRTLARKQMQQQILAAVKRKTKNKTPFKVMIGSNSGRDNSQDNSKNKH